MSRPGKGGQSRWGRPLCPYGQVHQRRPNLGDGTKHMQEVAARLADLKPLQRSDYNVEFNDEQ